MRHLSIIVGLLLLLALPALAQLEDTPTITYDQINEVAENLYCPICEYEPLDTCRVTTCIEWREEIRQQLADGRSEDEIIAYFVETYGDRVVGIPADNTLRTVSLLGPIVVLLGGLVVGTWTFLRWRSNRTPVEQTDTTTTYSNEDLSYRSRLEEDLNV